MRIRGAFNALRKSGASTRKKVLSKNHIARRAPVDYAGVVRRLLDHVWRRAEESIERGERSVFTDLLYLLLYRARADIIVNMVYEHGYTLDGVLDTYMMVLAVLRFFEEMGRSRLAGWLASRMGMKGVMELKRMVEQGIVGAVKDFCEYYLKTCGMTGKMILAPILGIRLLPEPEVLGRIIDRARQTMGVIGGEWVDRFNACARELENTVRNCGRTVQLDKTALIFLADDVLKPSRLDGLINPLKDLKVIVLDGKTEYDCQPNHEINVKMWTAQLVMKDESLPYNKTPINMPLDMVRIMAESGQVPTEYINYFEKEEEDGSGYVAQQFFYMHAPSTCDPSRLVEASRKIWSRISELIKKKYIEELNATYGVKDKLSLAGMLAPIIIDAGRRALEEHCGITVSKIGREYRGYTDIRARTPDNTPLLFSISDDEAEKIIAHTPDTLVEAIVKNAGKDLSIIKGNTVREAIKAWLAKQTPEQLARQALELLAKRKVKPKEKVTLKPYVLGEGYKEITVEAP